MLFFSALNKTKVIGGDGWSFLNLSSVGEAQHRVLLGGALLLVYEMCYLSKDFFMRSLLAARGVSWGDKHQVAKTKRSFVLCCSDSAASESRRGAGGSGLAARGAGDGERAGAGGARRALRSALQNGAAVRRAVAGRRRRSGCAPQYKSFFGFFAWFVL
jgi:hypothetical protein